MLSRVMLCLCMAIAPISAHADWQYATWGMSPEHVIAASKGVAVRAENPAVARVAGQVNLTDRGSIQRGAPGRQRLSGMPAVADYDGPGDDRAELERSLESLAE